MLLFLQIQEQEKPERSETTPSLAMPVMGLKVLCIDNDKDILDAMSSLLERWSCEAYCAESLADALEIIDKSDFKIDIMLVDYHISRSEKGIDVMQAIEAACGYKIPGILVTADVSEQVMSATRTYDYAYLLDGVSYNSFHLSTAILGFQWSPLIQNMFLVLTFFQKKAASNQF